MPRITEASTAAEVKTHLLYHLDSADENERAKNSSLNRAQAWNIFMGTVFNLPDDEIPYYLTIKNIIKEFGSHYEDESR